MVGVHQAAVLAQRAVNFLVSIHGTQLPATTLAEDGVLGPKTLEQINAQLRSQGFYKAFLPAGTKVVSWYVMMGIGQVVTLRLPASRLREVNRILENTAWGSYHTEFYPTYDYKPTGLASHEKAQTK